MESLGDLYQEGRNVAYDLKLAVDWYQKASEEGLESATIKLQNLENKLKNEAELDARNGNYSAYIHDVQNKIRGKWDSPI